MKIINLLFGNKIKSIISGVVLLAVMAQLINLVDRYKSALKEFNEKEEYKAYNATLEVQKDSMNKLITENQKNYDVTVGQLQGIVQQQRLVIKNKDKHIIELRSGLICKVPQKVKVGFLKYETKLVEVNCDSLQKTLE